MNNSDSQKHSVFWLSSLPALWVSTFSSLSLSCTSVWYSEYTAVFKNSPFFSRMSRQAGKIQKHAASDLSAAGSPFQQSIMFGTLYSSHYLICCCGMGWARGDFWQLWCSIHHFRGGNWRACTSWHLNLHLWKRWIEFLPHILAQCLSLSILSGFSFLLLLWNKTFTYSMNKEISAEYVTNSPQSGQLMENKSDDFPPFNLQMWSVLQMNN